MPLLFQMAIGRTGGGFGLLFLIFGTSFFNSVGESYGGESLHIMDVPEIEMA